MYLIVDVVTPNFHVRGWGTYNIGDMRINLQAKVTQQKFSLNLIKKKHFN